MVNIGNELHVVYSRELIVNVCEDCSGSYYVCEQCGNFFSRSFLGSRSSEGLFCLVCYNRLQGHRHSLIRDYSFKPRAMLTKGKTEKSDKQVYYGIELEIEAPAGQDITFCTQKLNSWLKENKVDRFVYFKNDGSLTNGVEVVFHPFTLDGMREHFPLYKFLRKVKDIGFTAYSNNHCGLHVHISRTAFRESRLNTGRRLDGCHAGKIFFYKCKPHLSRFSRRKDFHYCQFDSWMPADGWHQEFGRYSALNTNASEHTVEVRIFRGTTAHPRFLASLQFCDAFASYVMETSIIFFRMAPSEKLWKDFLSYCKAKGRYGHFLSYVRRNRI